MSESKCRSDKVEGLKLKLKSVTKMKLCMEKRALKLQNMEENLLGQLQGTKDEIALLTEELEDIKDEISEVGSVIWNLEMYKAAERAKHDSCIGDMKLLKKSFDELFVRERAISDLRNQELMQKEEEELEIEKQEQIIIAEKNEQQAREIADIEMETDAIERECAVLKVSRNLKQNEIECTPDSWSPCEVPWGNHEEIAVACCPPDSHLTKRHVKRNNAIMLKLRRKLFENEETRRELIQKHKLSPNENSSQNE